MQNAVCLPQPARLSLLIITAARLMQLGTRCGIVLLKCCSHATCSLLATTIQTQSREQRCSQTDAARHSQGSQEQRQWLAICWTAVLLVKTNAKPSQLRSSRVRHVKPGESRQAYQLIASYKALYSCLSIFCPSDRRHPAHCLQEPSSSFLCATFGARQRMHS